jgi:branched-chain amino acid transport system ATP-binding protein
MLAMARALIQRPKVLLVDELSMGLAPPVVEKLYTTIRQAVTDTGCSVVFVEQYVHVALEVADAVCVLNRGSIVLSGTASDVACQKAQLEDAYLGDQASGEPNGSDAAARLAAQ